MELVENPYTSDFTRKTLEQFGWIVGDPIPVAVGDLLVKLKTDMPSSARTDVLVDATLLSAEAMKTILDLLATAKRVKENRVRDALLETATQNMEPGVAALYAQLENDGPTIVDDRHAAPVTAPPPVVAAEEPVVEAPPAEEAPSDPPMVILPFCPRCGWDMRHKFDVEISDLDKQDFLASVLGNTRFERRFELMGGKVVLVFRSILAEENRLIHRQLVLDQDAKTVMTEAEWFLQLMEYRLACSLARIETDTGRVLHDVPALSEVKHTPPADKPLETALIGLHEFVNNKVLAHEVMRRLAGVHLRQFQRVVEGLEAMALEPSFWHGIG